MSDTLQARLAEALAPIANPRTGASVYQTQQVRDIAATRDDSGVLLDGSRLPNLPPSASALLNRPRGRGAIARTLRRSLLEEVIPTAYAIEGTARVELEVQAP